MLGEKLLCDRYILEEKLGSGSLGDLFRATDTESNRPVAVRLVTEVRDPLALSTFYRQWAIQAGLRHENVGAILDLTEATEDGDRYPVIVTPLIDGSPLCDLFVQPLNSSDPRHWLDAVERAAYGVQAAHERGLVHGRLHSGNVLLERNGGVKVVDFGGERVTDRAAGLAKDIEGLGAICFEALTSAEAPSDRATGEAALVAATSSTSEINRAICAALWPESVDSFSSAKEFAGALGSALRQSRDEHTKPTPQREPAPFRPLSQDPPFEELIAGTQKEPHVAQVDDDVASGLKGLGERMAGEASEMPVDAARSDGSVEERAAQQADLGAAVELLQTELALHPESARLQRLVLLYREKLDVVADVLSRIEQLEKDGKPEEAAEQRELLKSIHPASRPEVAAIGSRPAPLPEASRDAGESIEAFNLPELAESVAETIATVETEASSVVANAADDPIDTSDPPADQKLNWFAENHNQPQETEPAPESAEVPAPASTTDRATPQTFAQTIGANVSANDGPQQESVEPTEEDEPVREPLRPRVASLSASVKSQLQQLTSPAPESKREVIETKTNATPPTETTKTRPKWLYVAGIVAFALLMLVAAVLFSGTGGGAGADLRPAEIRAYPPQAEILIDGEACGVGECATELEVGVHRATARLAGFESEFQVFEIEPPSGRTSTSDAPAQRIELYLTALFASLEIETDLARGTVFLDDVNVGELEDGSFSLDEISDGKHQLRIRSGAVEATLVLETEAGSMPRVGDLTSKEAKVLVTASLGSSALFWSAPVATIAVDGEELGATTASGLPVDGLDDGPHRAGADGSAALASFHADNRPRLALSIDTDRNVGGLRIIAGQDGATVYINDRAYRRKTTRGALLVFLYPGTYRIRVEKPGFVTTPEYSVDITKGTREVVTADLSPQPQLSTLTLTDATPGAQVRIDGELVGEVSSSGTFSYGAVAAGERVVQIGKAGFRNRTVTEQFEIGQSVSIDGSLVRSSGQLTVSVTPADVPAHVVVRDSQGAIVRLENLRATLPEGGYRIEASANGFRSINTDVRVVGGENVVAEIRLESLAVPKPTGPQDLTTAFANDPSWTRQAQDLVRRGGGVVLVPAMGAGKYRFSVNLLRGRRLQWVANYVDGQHYGWFQMGRDNFIRSIVSAGERSKPVQEAHGLPDYHVVTIELEVSNDQIIHRLLRDGEWVELDRWKFTGANFLEGQFGFRLPGRDELAVRSLQFTAAP